MLSYDQIKFEKATVKLQQQKERDLIFEINKQSEILREKDNQLSQQASKMLERQLMFEIEVQLWVYRLIDWGGYSANGTAKGASTKRKSA